jgi:hypothetical protein
MIFEKKNAIDDKSLELFRRFLYLILFLFSFIQLIISSFSYETLFIVFTIYITSIYTIRSVLNRKILLNYFFPTLIILSLNFTLISGPLIFKTIFLQNIVSNLDSPIKTFCVVCVYQFILILCLTFYSNSNKALMLSKKINLSLINKLKAFNIPSIKYCIFLLLIFTLNKSYLNFVDQGSGSFTQYGDVGMKLLYAMEDFFFLPLICLSFHYFKNQTISNFFYSIILIFYILSGIIFGLASNSRQDILSIFFVIFSIIIFFKVFHIKKLNMFIKFLILTSIIFLFFFMETLSSNIIKNRGLRETISARDLLLLSMPNNQPSIEKDFMIKIPANDAYIDNKILDRLIFVKFLDKSLFFSKDFSKTEKSKFTEYNINRLISIFPITIINLFDKDFDKQDYIISNGSLIEGFYYGSYAGKNNTGSFLVELIILTNSYFITMIIIFMLNILFFIFIQSFQNNSNNFIQFSPILFIVIFYLLFLPNSDSTLGFLFNSIRRPLQLVILYLIINLLSKNQSLNFLKNENYS